MFKRFGKSEYEGLDGELIFGDPTAKDVYRRTTKAVMSQCSTDGADVVFYAFDTIRSPTSPYGIRQPQTIRDGVVNLTQHPVYNMDDLLHLEETLLDLGYEGLSFVIRKGNTSTDAALRSSKLCSSSNDSWMTSTKSSASRKGCTMEQSNQRRAWTNEEKLG